MPFLKPNKCYQLVSILKPSLNAVTTLDEQQLQQQISPFVTKHLHGTYQDELIQNLKIIAYYLLNANVSDSHKAVIIEKLKEDVDQCTPGFHCRLNSLLLGLHRPTSINDFLELIRTDLGQPEITKRFINILAKLEPEQQIRLLTQSSQPPFKSSKTVFIAALEQQPAIINDLLAIVAKLPIKQQTRILTAKNVQGDNWLMSAMPRSLPVNLPQELKGLVDMIVKLPIEERLTILTTKNNCRNSMLPHTVAVNFSLGCCSLLDIVETLPFASQLDLLIDTYKQVLLQRKDVKYRYNKTIADEWLAKVAETISLAIQQINVRLTTNIDSLS